MKCESCGTPAPEGAWVCPGCGAGLVPHGPDPRAVVGEDPVADDGASVWDEPGASEFDEIPPRTVASVAPTADPAPGPGAEPEDAPTPPAAATSADAPARSKPPSVGCIVAAALLVLGLTAACITFAFLSSLTETPADVPADTPIETPAEMPADLPTATPGVADDQGALLGPEPTTEVRDAALETLATYYHALQASDFTSVRAQMTGQAAADFDADPYETTTVEITSWQVARMYMDGAALVVSVDETLKDADGNEGGSQALYVLEQRGQKWLISEAEYGE